jgi:NAD/NADP transhydrogenase alpha subunit
MKVNMKIGIPKEIHRGEKRVATTPDVVTELQKLGFTVAIESGAGAAADFADAAYAEAGAEVVSETRGLWAGSDIIIKVRGPQMHPTLNIDEQALMHEGQVLISFLWPAQNPALLDALAARRITALAMDSIPRISRAQKLDALSSMANIAGYRAIVEAAQHFGRFFTGQITAAGKVPPAKVLVIGAGVAGLAAIGTAKSMGAIVRAFDTRPEVKEQVESMDAEFLLLEFEEEGSGAGGYAKVMSEEFIAAEMALFAEQAKDVDIIVTTALIPGKPAPQLITAEMVASMKPGSVIVDLAAEQGGNCVLTEPDRVVEQHGVTLIGYTDLPSRLAAQSSQLYASNLRNLLTDMCPDKNGELVGRTTAEAGSGPGARTCRRSQAKRARPIADFRRWRTGVARARARRPAIFHGALHRVRARLLHRLHGDLECDARVAHAVDERHQCDQQHHYHRRIAADQFGPDLDHVAGRHHGADYQHQHIRWLRSDASHARNVQEIGGRHATRSGYGRLHRRNNTFHSRPGWTESSGNGTPR